MPEGHPDRFSPGRTRPCDRTGRRQARRPGRVPDFRTCLSFSRRPSAQRKRFAGREEREGPCARRRQRFARHFCCRRPVAGPGADPRPATAHRARSGPTSVRRRDFRVPHMRDRTVGSNACEPAEKRVQSIRPFTCRSKRTGDANRTGPARLRLSGGIDGRPKSVQATSNPASRPTGTSLTAWRSLRSGCRAGPRRAGSTWPHGGPDRRVTRNIEFDDRGIEAISRARGCVEVTRAKDDVAFRGCQRPRDCKPDTAICSSHKRPFLCIRLNLHIAETSL